MDFFTGFTIFAAIVGVIAGVVQVLDYMEKRREKKRVLAAQLPTVQSQITAFDAQVIERFYLTRDKVTVRVHAKYEPPVSSDIRSLFDELNEKRKSKNISGYFSAQRFRPIIPPVVKNDTLEIDVTPLNYIYAALMKDELTPLEVKQKIQAVITQNAKRLPKSLSLNSYLFAQGYNLIGTETCLVTSDGYTLLRKRGKNVLRGNKQWDLSVSGHPASEDVSENLLDFAGTVQRETLSEIGSIKGDPRRIVFVGIIALHPNKVLGDMNIVAIWNIESSSTELREMITNKKSVKQEVVFKTEKRARESYVWDTENVLVKFDSPSILDACQSLSITFNDFVPEALLGLELALTSQNKGSLGVL